MDLASLDSNPEASHNSQLTKQNKPSGLIRLVSLRPDSPAIPRKRKIESVALIFLFARNLGESGGAWTSRYALRSNPEASHNS